MSEKTDPIPRETLRALGFQNEDRFFDALRNHPVDFPSWLYKVEKATAQEDKAGTDAWAYTDLGRIPIQIKSSCRRFEQFHRLHPDNPAVIVIVRATDLPRDIQKRTLQFLVEDRRKRYRQRRTARY